MGGGDTGEGVGAGVRSRGSRRALGGRRLAFRSVLVATLGPLVVLAAGCSQHNVLRPGGSAGFEIRTLAIQISAILGGVLVFVWVWLAVDIIRFRKRDESEASQSRGNLTIEIVWTLIPAAIVAVLFGLTVSATLSIALPDPGADFDCVGHQWWWEFDFPKEGFKTANEVYVPVGREVSIDLESTDVIHSFWVPAMGGKVDMNPGHVNHIRFTPLQTGTYLGQCSEFCGAQHGNMRFLFVVTTAAQYSAWVRNQQLPARQPTGADAVAGGQLIQTIACGGCHTIRGTPLKGTFGPDLTHFGSRGGIAAYTLVNTPQNLLRWIQDPQAVKPECTMPQIPLPLQEQQQLVAYLEELK
jgi:cytochrome c oxidase subunit 2